MPPVVYFGSPRQARLDADETLPAKLDLILNHLNLRERVHGETVLIKIHSGGNIGYSTWVGKMDALGDLSVDPGDVDEK